jgi:DnaJ-class molecular chaperone
MTDVAPSSRLMVDTRSPLDMRACPTCRGTGINPVLPVNVCPKCNGEREVPRAF